MSEAEKKLRTALSLKAKGFDVVVMCKNGRSLGLTRFRLRALAESIDEADSIPCYSVMDPLYDREAKRIRGLSKDTYYVESLYR